MLPVPCVAVCTRLWRRQRQRSGGARGGRRECSGCRRAPKVPLLRRPPRPEAQVTVTHGTCLHRRLGVLHVTGKDCWLFLLAKRFKHQHRQCQLAPMLVCCLAAAIHVLVSGVQTAQHSSQRVATLSCDLASHRVAAFLSVSSAAGRAHSSAAAGTQTAATPGHWMLCWAKMAPALHLSSLRQVCVRDAPCSLCLHYQHVQCSWMQCWGEDGAGSASQ